MDPLLPKVDLDLDEQWYLICNRLGLDPQKHFTSLHDRFNIKKFPLQDPFAFRQDVYDCADDAETQDQFHSNLENRMAQRFREVFNAWENICKCLSSSPEYMKVDLKPGSLNDGLEQRLAAFTRFTRTMSFDSMVMFFDGFARDEREEEEKERRSRKERMNSISRERAAKRLAAASRSIEVDVANSTPNSSSRTAGTKFNSLRDVLTPTSTATTISDKPLPTSSSRRHSPDQPEALARIRTTDSSTGRKRKNKDEDEDANGSERKKRCVMSESARVGDVERPSAGQHKWIAAEAAPTSKRAGKRKKTNALQDNIRNKRSRIINDTIPSFRQTPERAAELCEFERDMTPPGVTGIISLCSAVVQPRYNPDTSDEEGIQVGIRILKQNSPVSTDDNLSFTTAESSLKEDTGGTVMNLASKGYSNAEPDRELRRPFNQIAEIPAKISTISADKREFNPRLRPPRRQRVNKRPPRGELKHQSASSSIQRILRSSRSSRRDPEQELLFLGDDGTTCVVARKGPK